MKKIISLFLICMFMLTREVNPAEFSFENPRIEL